jgi:2-polyprenyl-3-methyl-5-hydroxy-6-metoxy-1,4-benzoquinol methylase
MSNYEKETLSAYRTIERAKEYKKYHTEDWSWARISTVREQKLLERELSRYNWKSTDRLLDIPCGTGILGKLLHKFPFKIVASDISPEMMALAKEEYPAGQLEECVQADITKTGFARASFDCIIVLGFLHRVPEEIKKATLKELAELSKGVVIVNCSTDSPMQRFKMKMLSIFWPNHIPAPCPNILPEMIAECEEAGFKVVRAFSVVPFLSAKSMLVLEKNNK